MPVNSSLEHAIKMKTKNTLPTIRQRKKVAKSKLFAIEQIDLTFSNGQQREYERMVGGGRGAVMIVPMLDDDTMILVREYCAGTHSYELGFPKGLVDEGETPTQSANRELQEEIGFQADELIHLQQVRIAPAFFDAKMEIFLGQGLTPSRLDGDEPEPLEVVHWKVADYALLLEQDDFNEARSIVALMMLLEHNRSKR